MSNAIYPVLPGLSFGVIMAPQWATVVKRAVSGKELRYAYMAYPLWNITLVYEFLRDVVAFNEFRTLANFFNARQGSNDSFLFSNPDDNAVTVQPFGTGDGATTTFQLLSSLTAGGFQAPIQNVNSAPLIYVNGVLKTVTTDYTVGATGIVTFVAAPAAAAPLTWTGTYYYRCRFLDDSLDFEKFLQNLWTLKKVRMVSVKL